MGILPIAINFDSLCVCVFSFLKIDWLIDFIFYFFKTFLILGLFIEQNLKLVKEC